MGLSYSLGTTRRDPREKFIDQAFSGKRAGYWPRFFSRKFMELGSVWAHKHAKKKLDRYPAVSVDLTLGLTAANFKPDLPAEPFGVNEEGENASDFFPDLFQNPTQPRIIHMFPPWTPQANILV